MSSKNPEFAACVTVLFFNHIPISDGLNEFDANEDLEISSYYKKFNQQEILLNIPSDTFHRRVCKKSKVFLIVIPIIFAIFLVVLAVFVLVYYRKKKKSGVIKKEEVIVDLNPNYGSQYYDTRVKTEFTDTNEYYE